MRIYSIIRDWGLQLEAVADILRDDFDLSPAEHATVMATGSIVLNDISVLAQIEDEPEDYSAYENMKMIDGRLVRWTDAGGWTQL